MRIILIGPPCGGKTTFLKKLQEKQIRVFSADKFIEDIYQKDQVGYEIIYQTFGDKYINPSGVNREELRKLVIKNPEDLKRLNEKIHPIIYDYLQGKDNYVAELPIIVNSPVKFEYDHLVLVTADDEIIQERLKKRMLNNQEFIKIILQKWNNKIKYDFVINTSNSISNSTVDQFIKKFNLKKDNG